MSLHDTLERIRADLEARIPAPALAIMHQATDDLVASGIETGIAQVGTDLPAFQLPDQDGVAQSSGELLAAGPLVITFYRGLWCPYCNADLAHLGSVQAEVEQHGGRLIAISPQQATWSRQVRERNNLAFPILTDAGNAYAAQLGLRFTLPDDLKKLYRDSFKIDLPQYHGEPSWTLPMPARFVVDRQGQITYAEASADYTRRPEPEAMIAALAAIEGS